MIRFAVHTAKRRCLLKVRLRASAPTKLIVRATDSHHRFSDYLRRRVPIGHSATGETSREIQIRLPISPRVLQVEIWNPESKAQYSIESLKLEPLQLNEAWADEHQSDFMRFASDFAAAAGYLPAGFYPDSADEFLIQYLPCIKDEYGNRQLTPARISRTFPRIQVSQEQFRRFTIPVRVAILAHESCHFLLNTRSEKEADLCGIKHYLDAGFPRIEAVYALTKVFAQFPHSIDAGLIQRVKDVSDFVKSYPALSTPALHSVSTFQSHGHD